MLLVPVLLAAASLVQDGGLVPATTVAAVPPPSSSGGAEALRQRIHDMRMNLLLGGDRVRKAESEVAEFRKFEQIRREFVELNTRICQLRPVEDTLSAEEKKRPKRSSRRSPKK